MVDSEISNLSTNLGSAAIIPNSTVWHNSSAENTTNFKPVIDFYSTGVDQTSASQIGIGHQGFIQLSTRQISTSEVGSTKISLSQSSTHEASAYEKSITQIALSQIRPTQGTIAQVASNHVSVENSTVKIRPTQVSSIQFPASTYSCKPDASKISLSNSVSSEQFINSYVSEFHDYLPPKFFDINNSALNLCNSLLKAQTLFDIDFVVKDLPVGQLAEAQITEYDSQGIPISGNILIDPDANGKGWFVDATPFDNNEFNTTLSDSAYRAATDSAAFGHYDLLTALLHEIGYLPSFIDGYKGFVFEKPHLPEVPAILLKSVLPTVLLHL